MVEGSDDVRDLEVPGLEFADVPFLFFPGDVEEGVEA